MSDERRDDDRSPDFRSVELVTINSGGNEKTYPVTLRDTSGNGLGGMYVGEDVLSPTATFVLRESRGRRGPQGPYRLDQAGRRLRADVGARGFGELIRPDGGQSSP